MSDPSPRDLEDAIREVFHESELGLQEGDYVEHPNAWLTYEFESGDNWVVYCLDLYRKGLIIYSKFEDQDDLSPAFERRCNCISEEDALRYWKCLASGKIEELDTLLKG